MKNKILVIACLVLVLCVSLVLPMTTAFADYTEDVLNNPNAVVNFNQLVNNTYINGYSFPSEYNIICESNFIANHKIYINFNVVEDNQTFYEMRFHNSDGTIRQNVFNGFINSDVDTIITLNNNFVDLRIYVANYFLNTKNIKVIDLSACFGIGNEPNLQECQDLFIADYYAYNTGTAISLSGINAFEEGYNAALSAFDVIRSGDEVIDSVYNVNASYFAVDHYNTYTSLRFSGGIVAIPIGITLLPNDTITIELPYMSLPDLSSLNNNYFSFGAYVGGSFVTFANYSYQDFTRNEQGGLILYSGSVTFTVLSETNVLYMRNLVMNSSNDYISMEMRNFTFTIRTINAYSGLDEQFKLGYKKAEKYYQDLYKVGGSAYQAIYNKGYYDYPNDDHFTFKSLITSAVDVPVQAFTNLFDFDILGVNMKTFYLSVFTLCVIFVVLRLVL